MKKTENIDAYLEVIAPDFQTSLQRLRSEIHSFVPEAKECISYGIPTFQLQGKSFAGFGAYKNFMSFYPFGGDILKEFQDELQDFECSKSAIHFTPEHLIPKELLRKLILRRIDLIPKK